MRRSQNLEIVKLKKQLHEGSVQFLASFTSFDFEILQDTPFLLSLYMLIIIREVLPSIRAFD